MNRFARIALAATFLTTSTSLHAAQPTREIRSHLALSMPGAKSPAYTITWIQHPDDEFETTEMFLIMDADHHRFVVSHTRNYFDQTATYEIKDYERDIAVRSTLQFPFLAKSKHETAQEAKTHPDPDIPITVVAGGASATGLASQWKSGPSRNLWRAQLRRGMDPQLLEAIEEMRALMHDSLLLPACTFLTTTLLFEEPCTGSTPLEMKELPPDCDFDAGFGMKCSNEQKQKIADALANKQTLSDY